MIADISKNYSRKNIRLNYDKSVLRVNRVNKYDILEVKCREMIKCSKKKD